MLDMSTAEAGFEQLPVTLTHAHRPRLSELLAEASAAEPHLDVGAGEESRHSVWIRQDTVFVRAVLAELGALDTLYIADGHHRIAAAERYGSRRAGQSSAFTLATLFPSEQVRVFGYNRSLPRPAEYSTRELLAALVGTHGVERIEPYPRGCTVAATPGPGTVTVYLDGTWHRMVLSAADERSDTRDSLDAVRLDEGVLTSFASTVGLDPHTALTPVPSGSTGELVRGCDEQPAIGFVAHPPSVEAIMAVSDAGRVLPPKSTWFAPKASAGLFVRELT